MTRTSKYITIEGQYAEGVLGTFRIIRGFATLQDLAMISAPFPMSAPDTNGHPISGHQRAVDSQHAESIKRYLQDGKPRFIPEIILSIRAEYRDELDSQHSPVGILSDSTSGLRIRRRFKSRNIATHQIVIERSQLSTLIETESRIRRIDGNHRLHLANDLVEDGTSPTKYLAPFCAVLLGEPADENDNFVESMLFHTINSTALPLESEHALQLVLGQLQEFRPTEEEEFNANPPLHFTRLLKTRMDALPAQQRRRLGDTPATVLHSAARAMLTANADLAESRDSLAEHADELCAAVNDILARLPAMHPQFCKSELFIELAALAWSETSAEADYEHRVNATVKTLDGIGKWLGRDGFHRIESKRSLAEQLFEIFRAVRRRIPKRIFLSRWYPVDADGDELRKANLRKDMIDRTLDDLRGEGIDLALDDPGTLTGGTFPIHNEMYDAIANDDIILIDLSGVRPNVCIEAGYALDYHKKGRLLFMFQATDQTANNPEFRRPPFDLNTFRYEPITDAAEIPNRLKNHLRTIHREAVAGRA